MSEPIVSQSPSEGNKQEFQVSDELVIRFGEYELTLRPEFSTIILCAKGGRVCVEKIEDEHIFAALYEILNEYAESDDEVWEPAPLKFHVGQRVKIVREDDIYCGGYGCIVGHVNSRPHPWQVMPDGWDETLGPVAYADDELDEDAIAEAIGPVRDVEVQG